MTGPTDRNCATKRRTFLKGVAGAAALGGATGVVTAQQDGPQLIVLGGRTTAWKGRAPSSIEGERNPTLPLVPGNEYKVRWTNVDGLPHNFVLLTDEGEVLLSTDIIREDGATQTVTFTATERMGQYYCEVHPRSMRGNVELVEQPQLGTVEQTQTTPQPAQEPEGEYNESEPIGVDAEGPIPIANATDENETIVEEVKQFRQDRERLFELTGNATGGDVRGNLTYPGNVTLNDTAAGRETVNVTNGNATNGNVTNGNATNGNATNVSVSRNLGGVSESSAGRVTRGPGFGVVAAVGGLLGAASLLSSDDSDED